MNTVLLAARLFRCLGLHRLALLAGVVKPKVIARLDGGLGSQMWQFAVGYAVAQRTGLPLYLDNRFFATNGCDIKGVHNRHFLLLDTFPNIREHYRDRLISDNSDKIIRHCFSDACIRREPGDYNAELFDLHPVYLYQYYSNIKYIAGYEDDIRNLLRFDVKLSPYEEEFRQRMLHSPNACTVHIRKGDYVGSVHDVCSDGYYLRAIDCILERFPDAEFFIFSNDEAYARRLCGQTAAKTAILEARNEDDPRHDMYLLTQSRHSIIANSNFSWMGAFLREAQGGMTIMPDIWFKDSAGNTTDSSIWQLDGWLQLHA